MTNMKATCDYSKLPYHLLRLSQSTVAETGQDLGTSLFRYKVFRAAGVTLLPLGIQWVTLTQGFPAGIRVLEANNQNFIESSHESQFLHSPPSCFSGSCKPGQPGRSHRFNNPSLVWTNMELKARKQSLFNSCPREVKLKTCENPGSCLAKHGAAKCINPRGLSTALTLTICSQT